MHRKAVWGAAERETDLIRGRRDGVDDLHLTGFAGVASRTSCMDDLRGARVEVDVGARSSAVMYTACRCSWSKLLALMKSADRLPDHVNALEAL